MADSAAVLKLFFAIPGSRISMDIDAGWVEPDRKSRRSNTPEEVAEEHHKDMVRAWHLQSREDLTESAKVFSAMMYANDIAELGVDVAFAKGRLAELNDLMEEIHKRDGLVEGEYWPIGEGPEDYQALAQESEEWVRKIHDTIVSTVFRRYHLTDLADLFENDRTRFDQISENGRKEIFDKPKRTKGHRRQ